MTPLPHSDEDIIPGLSLIILLPWAPRWRMTNLNAANLANNYGLWRQEANSTLLTDFTVMSRALQRSVTYPNATNAANLAYNFIAFSAEKELTSPEVKEFTNILLEHFPL